VKIQRLFDAGTKNIECCYCSLQSSCVIEESASAFGESALRCSCFRLGLLLGYRSLLESLKSDGQDKTLLADSSRKIENILRIKTVNFVPVG